MSEIEDDDIVHVTHVFPSYRQQDDRPRIASSLFPCVHPTHDASDQPAADSANKCLLSKIPGNAGFSSTDWLSNSSFDPNHAQLIHKRLTSHQHGGSSDHKRNNVAVGHVTEFVEDTHSSNAKKNRKHRSKRRRRYSRSPDYHFGNRSRSQTRSSSASLSRSRSPSEERSSDHRKKHKKVKKRERKKKKRDRSDASEGEARAPVLAGAKGKIFIDDIPNLNVEDAYRIDRTSDANNVAYGSLYKLHVPKYRRLVNLCMGCNPSRPVYASDKRETQHEKSVLSRSLYITDEGTRIIAAKRELEDFMSINEENERTTEASVVNPLNVYDAVTEGYLQGKGGLHSATDPEVSVRTAVDDKIAQYNKYLRDYPNDVNKWLEFVKFQDEFTKSNKRTIKGASEEMEARKVSEAAVIEKKISILDKALLLNSGNLRLQVCRLELSRSLMEPSQLKSHWRSFVSAHQDDPSVWRSFVTYHQTDLTRFTVKATLSVYAKCLTTLNKLKSRQLRHLTIPLDVEWHMLEIFVRLCHFLRQTGHTEIAVAAYQAMMEYNFHPPASVADEKTDHEIKLAVFEAFWDASAPRFGELGAPGWATWLKNKHVHHPGSTESEEDFETMVSDKSQLKGKVWLRIETGRESSAWLPWRADMHSGQGHDDVDDPDRVVLYDDICSFLFTVQNGDVKLALIDEFARFLGRHRSASSHSLLYVNRAATALETDLNIWDYPHFDPKQVSVLVSNMLNSLPNLFTDIELKRKAYELAMELSVAVKHPSKSELKAIRKFVKSLLQLDGNRNRLELWIIYAEFEYRMDNSDTCKKILSTALMQTTDLESPFLADVYKYFLEVHLGLIKGTLDEGTDVLKKRNLSEDERNIAVYLCSCLCNCAKFDPSTKIASGTCVLKTRKQFLDNVLKLKDSLLWKVKEEAIEECLRKLRMFSSWSFCFAVFQYLTVGADRADAVLDETARTLDNGFGSVSPRESFARLHEEHERFHVDRVRLLALTVNTSVRSLGVLRDVVLTALDMFPDSEVLLHWLASVEARSQLSGRWRRYVDDNVGLTRTPLLWIAALKAELRRMKTNSLTDGEDEVFSSSRKYRLRSLFERATACATGRNIILIWRLYMKFEFDIGDTDRAKAVFYRSLQQCPWAKCLFMDAVRYFPLDLQEITDLIVEKGLRLRCIPEELDILMQEEK